MRSLQLAAGAAALAIAGAAPAYAQPEEAEPASPVEPEAKAALDRMSAYMRTLTAFEIKTATSLDVVTEAGQRIQIDGTAAYKVKRPDSFVISVDTDWKKRSFYYDGKQFTVYAPELGYYASAPAPATIRETLDVVADKYGIVLPIEDLFRWNDPSSRQTEALDGAMHIGTATVDGTKTEQYAFRQGMVDWQVWIQTGDQPLPRKLVIVDRSELAQPAYVARLTWTLNPPLKSDDFAFKPRKDAMSIHLTSIGSSRGTP
jgi:hypothetical protein